MFSWHDCTWQQYHIPRASNIFSVCCLLGPNFTLRDSKRKGQRCLCFLNTSGNPELLSVQLTMIRKRISAIYRKINTRTVINSTVNFFARLSIFFLLSLYHQECKDKTSSTFWCGGCWVKYFASWVDTCTCWVVKEGEDSPNKDPVVLSMAIFPVSTFPLNCQGQITKPPDLQNHKIIE